MNNKIIIGTGRQAAETFYLLEDLKIASEISCFVIDLAKGEQAFFGKPVKAISSVLNEFRDSSIKPSVFVAIGDVGINKRITTLLKEEGYSFFNIIHHSINLTRQRFIGEGVMLCEGTILTCNIHIGNYSLINIGCTISHDCTIGNHVNISPGTHLAGNVTIEDEVFVGTGAIFLPNVRVGKGCIIAAGASVTKDVPPYSMVAGVPAVIKKSLK